MSKLLQEMACETLSHFARVSLKHVKDSLGSAGIDHKKFHIAVCIIPRPGFEELECETIATNIGRGLDLISGTDLSADSYSPSTAVKQLESIEEFLDHLLIAVDESHAIVKTAYEELLSAPPKEEQQ
jgi:hypothetical protein